MNFAKRIFQMRKIDNSVAKMLEELMLSADECESMLSLMKPISFESLKEGDRAIKVFKLEGHSVWIHYAVISILSDDYKSLGSKGNRYFLLELTENEANSLKSDFYVL